MSVFGAAAKLLDVDQRLRQHWSAVRVHWQDDKMRQFEEEIIQPLLGRIRATERALGELGSILQQVHRDCD